MSNIPAFIQKFFGTAEQLYNPDQGSIQVQFALSSNQDDGIVSFANGYLTYTPASTTIITLPNGITIPWPVPENFSAGVDYYFSNLLYPGEGLLDTGGPFNNSQNVTLQVTILNTSPGIFVTLTPSNSGTFSFNIIDADADVIFGVGNGVVDGFYNVSGYNPTNALYTISIYNLEFLNNPR